MKRGLVRFNAAYHSGLERDVIPKLLRRMTEVGNLVKLIRWSIFFFQKNQLFLFLFEEKSQPNMFSYTNIRIPHQQQNLATNSTLSI